MNNLMKDIPRLNGSRITPIEKGYSTDKKYLVEYSDGRKELLKLFDISELDAKKQEYSILEQMIGLDVKCSLPIDIGELESSPLGYMLLSYVDGQDALEVLPAYSESVQYMIGLEAGQQLRKIHQLEAPQEIPSWYERKIAKHRRYVDRYYQCGIRVIHDNKLLSFIDRHADLMKDRPNLFQHDDFHVGNLIVKDEVLSGVIDFNRYDWGDPIHEFLKVGMFSSEVSVPFANGQIAGYFNGEEPGEEFWVLYSLYMAMSVLSSVVWIQKVSPDELDFMLDRLNRVIQDHNDFDSVRPKWFGN
ncbi:aminoglycoside phosphotransferase family protein [Paenibacillus sediminis]|uniref:Aminoglycoside phosphotransferase (APT) family kinase protein n=1 Tax=Paenibacillus sediminis TaxID=664909 RepID=A0ABS4H229_9BACL|nr:aminoglycoside phosphotransferase family protein [Paenibacillus sediminis]MBP1936516.1 aminoglycoside phosphotransferase (APT) family kinase protein [Paenibacillus sediminis]